MIGETKYQELVDLRETIMKFDWDAEAERLYAVAKERGIL
jgi:hypothetical protein